MSTTNNMSDLWSVCRDGDLAGLEVMLARGEDCNAKNYAGDTPLMIAMVYNHSPIVRRLLSIPSLRLDITDIRGGTALHHACYSNSPSVIPLYGRDSRCTL